MQRKRENMCVTKKTGRKTDKDIVMGEREEEGNGQRPRNSRGGGMCRGGKVEMG